MSLPPDPHDDDLADPSPAPPPSPPAAAAAGSPATAADPATPTEPPAGAAPADPPPPPPPPPPAPTDPGAHGDTTVGATAWPGRAGVTPAGQTTATLPAVDADRATPASAPAPATAAGVRGRLGWMLAAVVAVMVAAGAVVVARGDDDPASETSAEDGGAPDQSSGQPSGQSSGADEPSSGGGEDGDPGAGEGPPTGSGPDSPVSSPAAGDRPDTPVEVAEAFFTAVEQGDCETIIAHMTVESFSTDGQTPEQAVAECEADEEGLLAITSAEFWEVEPLSERGDRASVAVTVVAGGEESVRELPLRRVGGVWKMDLDPTAAPAAG